MSSVAKVQQRMYAKANNHKHRRTVKHNHQNDPSQHEDEEKVRMFYKEGSSTMLFCRMPYLACKCLEANINRFMERKHQKLNGKFIITH